MATTGSAAYAVDVIGAINTDWDNIPESFTGDGALVVDFGSGSVSADAQFIIIRADGSRLSNADFDGTISLDAVLASNKLSFAGDVEVRSFGIYTGTADGGFFGPDGVEVGASYSAKSTDGKVGLSETIRIEPVPLDHGRKRRLASREQRIALAVQHTSCLICDAPFAHTQAHHKTPWNHGGRTDLRNLGPLCSHHHHLVHDKGWALVQDADGAWTLTPPRARSDRDAA